jgi:hypothetical protein
MRGPPLKRLALLIREVMMLIRRNDPGEGAGGMAEAFFYDGNADADPGYAGRHAAQDVVQSIARYGIPKPLV